MSANSATTVKKNEQAVEDSRAYVADDNHRMIYQEAQAVKAQIDALKKTLGELNELVRTDMETLGVEKMVDVDNSTMFTLNTSTRTQLNTTALKKDLPEIWEEYGTTKEVTTFKMY